MKFTTQSRTPEDRGSRAFSVSLWSLCSVPVVANTRRVGLGWKMAGFVQASFILHTARERWIVDLNGAFHYLATVCARSVSLGFLAGSRTGRAVTGEVVVHFILNRNSPGLNGLRGLGGERMEFCILLRLCCRLDSAVTTQLSTAKGRSHRGLLNLYAF